MMSSGSKEQRVDKFPSGQGTIRGCGCPQFTKGPFMKLFIKSASIPCGRKSWPTFLGDSHLIQMRSFDSRTNKTLYESCVPSIFILESLCLDPFPLIPAKTL